ncbi:MAG: nitroreductase family protein [Phycisphaerales bacterium]
MKTQGADPVSNPRTPAVDIDPMFTDRWSPRAYDAEHEVTEDEIASVMEAARWSPSSYNEQPWVFVYARSKEDHARFLELLVEGNRKWADQAPVLIFALAKRTFDKNGKPNRHYAFDTGAAWMAMSLQARKLGLYTHGMAGFHEDKAYEALGVDREKYEVMAAIALGRRADASTLDDEGMRKGEKPNDRKPLEKVAYEGRFSA